MNGLRISAVVLELLPCPCVALPVFVSSYTRLVAQVTDGAAAVLMMTRREALNRQLPILGIFRSFAAVGVDPAIMGVGPAVAIPEAVKQAGLTIDDIDLFELNEAFASQVIMWLSFAVAAVFLTTMP